MASPIVSKHVQDGVVAAYARGDAAADICEEFETTWRTVLRCVERAGVERRKTKGTRRKRITVATWRSVEREDTAHGQGTVEELETEYLRRLMTRDAVIWQQRTLATERRA